MRPIRFSGPRGQPRGFESPRPPSRFLRFTADPFTGAAWALAFGVVTYLGLSGGGYDTIVQSRVGIVIWWIVLLGAAIGILPARTGRTGWAAIALLAAFALWNGLAIGWSQSPERSTVEMARVVAYLGVLLLAILLHGRAAARHTLNGLTCAIGFVTVLAVLSRLHPQWFPVNDHVEFLGPEAARKLSYPLNYWNALAAFAAIGLPLLLGAALSARTRLGRAFAAGTIPMVALCIYLTVSRGGVLAALAALVVFFIVVPRRVDALETLVIAGLGSIVLVAVASRSDALQDAAPTAPAFHQGTALLLLSIGVCIGVGAAQTSVEGSRWRRDRPAVLRPSPGRLLLLTRNVVLVVSVLAIVTGMPGRVYDRWQDFTAPSGVVDDRARDSVFSRLSAANGNDRYQYWQTAMDANASDPLKGIGPGTFEFWWARYGTRPGFLRHAYSLYVDTIAETGVVGFLLLASLLALFVVTAIRRALRAPPATRIWIAAALSGLVAFLVSAALEWVWQVGALACVAMLLGAVLVAGKDDESQGTEREHAARRPVRLPRAVPVMMAVAALCAVGIPMAAALAMRNSDRALADGRLAAALENARVAQRIQPYAATPRLQQALALEQAGDLRRAAAAARAATAREPTNWRTWFVLARIQAQGGDADVAVQTLRRARQLNPRAKLLGAQGPQAQ